MTKNLTKAQASLGKGIVIARGSAHQVYVASQTLSEAQHPPPRPPPMGRRGAGSPQRALYQGGLHSGPLREWFPGAETWSSFLYNFM